MWDYPQYMPRFQYLILENILKVNLILVLINVLTNVLTNVIKNVLIKVYIKIFNLIFLQTNSLKLSESYKFGHHWCHIN